jgi:hypothetical protein
MVDRKASVWETLPSFGSEKAGIGLAVADDAIDRALPPGQRKTKGEQNEFKLTYTQCHYHYHCGMSQ